MDILDNESTVQTSDDDKSKVSFADQVNTAVNEMKQGEDGNYIIPDNLSDEVKVAVVAEKRRRDTQSSFSKSQQALKVAEKENVRLRELIVPQLNLTVAQKEELHDLKSTDPDAWKVKLTGYENEAKSKLAEDLAEITTATTVEAETARRATVLEDFINTNPGFVINDDVLANDIPPRIKNKLEKGKITFEAFLTEAMDFMSSTKKIGDANKSDEEPDLGNAGGGAKAESGAVDTDIAKSYANEIY